MSANFVIAIAAVAILASLLITGRWTVEDTLDLLFGILLDDDD